MCPLPLRERAWRFCNESYWVRGFLRQMHFAKRTPHPFLPRGTTVMPSPNASRACPTCARECETRASPGFVGEGVTMHAGHAHDIRPPQQRHRASVQPEQRGSGRRLRSPRPLVGARVGQSQAVRLCRAASFRSIQTAGNLGYALLPQRRRPARAARSSRHLHAGGNDGAAPARWRRSRRAQRHRLCRKLRRRRQRGGPAPRHAVAQAIADTGIAVVGPNCMGVACGVSKFSTVPDETLHAARAGPGRRRGAERRDGHLAQPRHQRSRPEVRLSRLLRQPVRLHGRRLHRLLRRRRASARHPLLHRRRYRTQRISSKRPAARATMARSSSR